MKKSTDRYEEIRKEAESWPNWKKEVYNSLATSAHAKKIPLAPPTWNDRINQMTVEEKAKLFDSIGFCMNGFVSDEDCNANKDCMSCALKWLASPYTEGEKK